MEELNKQPSLESLQHLTKDEQEKELKSAIAASELGKMNDRKRKAIESVKKLMHKRFGTQN